MQMSQSGARLVIISCVAQCVLGSEIDPCQKSSPCANAEVSVTVGDLKVCRSLQIYQQMDMVRLVQVWRVNAHVPDACFQSGLYVVWRWDCEAFGHLYLYNRKVL